MPQGEVALGSEQIGRGDASVILEAGQEVILRHRNAWTTNETKGPEDALADFVKRHGLVIIVYRNCAYGQNSCGVFAIGQERIAILKKTHGPIVFAPFEK